MAGRSGGRRGPALSLAAALVLTIAGLGGASAQTGIFRLFVPQQAAPPETAESAQRFADAEEEVVATGAPMTIRPSDDKLKQLAAQDNLPLPPRRPAEFPQRKEGASATLATNETKAAAPPAADAEPTSALPPAAPARTALAPSALPMAVEGGAVAPEPAENSRLLAFAQPPGTRFGGPSQSVLQPTRQAPLAAPLIRLEATPGEIEAEEELAPEPVHVEKQTDYVNIACLDSHLLQVIQRAGAHFGGKPVITSGLRTNGRRGSYHRRCQAADFFVPGIDRAVLANWLRSQPDAGGVGTYCHTKSVHLDIGEARNWTQCGFRFRFALRGPADGRRG